MKPKFKWTCSYRGTQWFDVTDETGTYEVELRHTITESDRTDYTGTAAEWDREVVASLNVLHRSYRSSREIPASTVAAFNEWRQAERDRLFAEMAADPQRYGDPGTFAEHFKPITPARGGRYVIGTGWVITYEPREGGHALNQVGARHESKAADVASGS